jgi:hypothetical protein
VTASAVRGRSTRIGAGGFDILASALVAMTVVALPLAGAGIMRPLLTLPLVAIVTGALVVWLWREPSQALPPARGPIAVALVIAAAFAASNAKYATQHVVIDSDPGVYLVEARWIAGHGGIVIERGDELELFGPTPPAYFNAAGWRGEGAHHERLIPQFQFLGPVVFAVAHWAGGTWLLIKANAIVFALALLMMFAFARRLAGGWFALLPVAAFAVSLPGAVFGRDMYSEPLTMLLVFSGLTALWDAMTNAAPRRAALAGALLGATLASRIDAALVLAPLAAVGAAALVLAHRRGDRARERLLWTTAGGAAVTIVAGAAVLPWTGTAYIDAALDYAPSVWALVGLVAVVCVLVAGLRFAYPRLRRIDRNTWARAGGALVIVVAGLLAVRAAVVTGHRNWDVHLTAVIADLQRGSGLPVDPTRTYSEDTLRWLWWYFGPVALLAGAGGAALLVHHMIRRADWRAAPFLVAFAAVGLVYLLDPRITPFQPWAMRRFVPIVVPALLILSAYVAAVAWRRWPRPASRALVGVGAAVMVVWPVCAFAPLATTPDRGPVAYAIEDACPPARSVVLLPKTEDLAPRLAISYRALCDRPTAITESGPEDPAFEALVDRLVDHGARPFMLVSGAALPGDIGVVDIGYRDLERPIDHPPSDTQERRLVFALRPVG